MILFLQLVHLSFHLPLLLLTFFQSFPELHYDLTLSITFCCDSGSSLVIFVSSRHQHSPTFLVLFLPLSRHIDIHILDITCKHLPTRYLRRQPFLSPSRLPTVCSLTRRSSEDRQKLFKRMRFDSILLMLVMRGIKT